MTSCTCRTQCRRAQRLSKHRPHPEEHRASDASRRMDAAPVLAAILRDARKSALLRMRPEIHSTTSQDEDGDSFTGTMSASPRRTPGPITTVVAGQERSSTSVPDSSNHAVWVPARGRDDDVVRVRPAPPRSAPPAAWGRACFGGDFSSARILSASADVAGL